MNPDELTRLEELLLGFLTSCAGRLEGEAISVILRGVRRRRAYLTRK